jgi:hypothetical protein
VKDAFAVHRGDTWTFGYSRISEAPFRFRLGFTSTTDFRTFTDAPVIDQEEVGGLASPDVVTTPDGRYLMTYNSHTRDVGESANKLYYRTSSDLVAWSDPVRIHIDGADGEDDRLIDGALAFSDAGAFLLFKREQTANVAFASSGSPDGPWTLLGPMEPDRVENLQVLRIDGTWHLLVTSLLPHLPVLYRLTGDVADPESFRSWTKVRELAVQDQSWNTGELFRHERANAGYLIDDRARDGFFYLLYAGSTEVSSYEGRGHAKLGLSRSADLITWEPAAER